jgi:glycosyltransferase involved in cell wall biosynthesis
LASPYIKGGQIVNKGFGGVTEIGLKNPLISVIVPVYNIEKYIRKCVDSIVKQTYKNIEIILVDDGSTDSCPAICDELATLDTRIKVLHTANGGSSVARNVGIKISKGDCITFIDGDDYVTSNYVLYLHELTKEYHADISITNYCIQHDGKEKLKEQKEHPYVVFMNRYEALDTFLHQKHFGPSVWGKLFYRSLFDEVEFPEGKVAQDLGIIYKLLDRANRVVYSSAVDYIYVQRSTSITYTQRDRLENDVPEILEEMTRYITAKYPDLEDAVTCCCFGHNIRNLKHIPFREIYAEKHKNVRDNIVRYRKSVLMNPKVSFNTRSCAALSYLGIGTLKVCKTLYDKIKF